MKIKIRDKVYDVEISELEEGKVKIIVNGKEFIFGETVGEQEKISAVQVAIPKRNFTKKEIKAPIAGTISKIFVKEGEFVKKDQKILVLSSMKMENELVSDFEGKVKEILVKENQNVKEEDILIILQ
jgi:biotin carboxyl carrier protein